MSEGSLGVAIDDGFGNVRYSPAQRERALSYVQGHLPELAEQGAGAESRRAAGQAEKSC